MATILLMVFFSDKGTPKTGLSPTIDGYEDDGTQVITAQAMTEVAGGWYKYSFGSYDETKDYGFVADGTNTLNANDRYAYASNEIGQVTEDITGVKTDTAAILIDTDTMEADLKTHMDTKETNIISEVDDNETKIDTAITDIGNLNDLSAANVETACDASLVTYDSPTKAELDTAEAAIITQIDANETKIDALNNVSQAEVNAQCDQALTDYDGPTRAELTTDKDSIVAEVDANETKIDSIVTLLTRSIGLMQENQYLDTTVYDANNNLTLGRIRIYSVSGSVGTDNDVLATYTITATYNDDNELQTYKVVKS